MQGFYSFMGQVLIVAIPLIIIGLAGMFTERGGVTNIALDGMMIMGAFVGILVLNSIPFTNQVGGYFAYVLGMIVAAIGGGALSMLHSWASIKMKGNQIVSATAINNIVPSFSVLAITVLHLSSIGGGKTGYTEKIGILGKQFLKVTDVPLLSKIPFIGDIFFKNVSPNLYLGIAILIVSAIVLNKTRFGLRLKSCGENPSAADSAGINPNKMRYIGVLLSGILAGIGGFFLITGYTNEFASTVNGYGFLALGIIIFGNWKPMGIVLASFLFSILISLAAGIAYFKPLEELFSTLHITGNVINILPYLFTIIVLIFTSKNSHAPADKGVLYDKSK